MQGFNVASNDGALRNAIPHDGRSAVEAHDETSIQHALVGGRLCVAVLYCRLLQVLARPQMLMALVSFLCTKVVGTAFTVSPFML